MEENKKKLEIFRGREAQRMEEGEEGAEIQDQTFVSGGVFTLFHCSLPRGRNPGNHHTRESLKGVSLCALLSPLTLSTLPTLSLSFFPSLSLSHAIVSFKCFVVYIIIRIG